MQIQTSNRSRREGSALFMVVSVIALIGIALTTFLKLTSSQNQFTTRSQVWNSCIPVAEAGIEEALTHAENNYETNMISNGWAKSVDAYSKSNAVGGGYYLVAISETTPYTIVSRGYLPMAGRQDHLFRTVRVHTLPQGLLMGSLVVRDSIKLNGNNIRTDSYNSRDPYMSTLGIYDPLKAGEKGDIGSVSGLADAFNVGNANIQGKVFTAPGGSISLGPNGAVGSKAWHQSGNGGIESGWWKKDFNMEIPDVDPPFESGALPSGGTIAGVDYGLILGTGQYVAPSLSGNVLVTGEASLLVKGDVDFKTGQQLIIAPGGKLNLYVAGSRTKIGEIINQDGSAHSLKYFGLATNTRIDIIGQNALTAAIYAPSADVNFSAGVNLYGSVVAKTATLNGHSTFHYDESLTETDPKRRVVVDTWDEL